MDIKKINDIEVHDFIELSPSKETMRAIDIEKARQLLKSEGYFVDNLWQTCDVTINYKCTEEQAQEVLERALTYDSVYQLVWEGIKYEAEEMNLTPID
jgi:hypothetical protein